MIEDLERYLESVRDLYPHGVKVRVIRPMIVVASTDRARYQELLNSIIERGLQRDLNSIDIIDWSSELIIEPGSKVLWMVKTEPPAGDITATCTLAEVAEDPGLKREFWVVLKVWAKGMNS